MYAKLSVYIGVAVALLLGTANIQPSYAGNKAGSARYVTVSNNAGGHVIHYARQVLVWKKVGAQVRFSGRCASACTLYLSLNPRNMCIAPGASFHFHAPYGAGSRGNSGAKSFMMRSYPSWVRSWINKRGGLTSRLIAMDYGYARRFVRECSVVKAQRHQARNRIGETTLVQ
jgi:hypothetical protein